MDLEKEKKLWSKGYAEPAYPVHKIIVGVDESGRGPLAGPVVAAVVTITNDYDYDPDTTDSLNQATGQGNDNDPEPSGSGQGKRRGPPKAGGRNSKLRGIKGSKRLSPNRRKHFYNLINDCPQLEWATSRVGAKVIDKINILEATKLAMKRAIINLEKKIKKVDYLLIDGNFEIDSKIPQQSIINGDQEVFLIAAASIIAKVSRDRSMRRYHKKWPQYGFAQHKGYPTEFHRKVVTKEGPCKIHRKTFKPVKNMVE